MNTQKVFLTWEDVYELLDNLHEQTKDSIRFVTGIPRGGIILAVLYSHRFNIPYMEFMSNHYTDMLILDDIADTGDTFIDLSDMYPKPKKGVLHYKSSSKFKPHFFAKEISDDYGWIVYPWEREDSKPIQDYLDN